MPVVFIHGWQGDRTVWDDVVAALGDDVLALTPDLPGSGDANAAFGPFTLERFAAHVREAIQELDAGPAFVVGHSMGATVALRLAVDAPAAVRGLVLITPVPASGAGFSPKGEAYLRATAGDAANAKRWLARTLCEPEDGANLERLCASAAKTPRAAALESFASWAHAGFAEETRAIAAPTLVIAAEHDSPETSTSNVAALIPNARCIVLPNAAHYAIVERPNEIASLIRGFVCG